MRTSPASDVLDAGLHLGRCFVTWTKLDDLWCERRELAAINFADRWHYLAMIQFCSRADPVSYTHLTLPTNREV